MSISGGADNYKCFTEVKSCIMFFILSINYTKLLNLVITYLLLSDRTCCDIFWLVFNFSQFWGKIFFSTISDKWQTFCLNLRIYKKTVFAQAILIFIYPIKYIHFAWKTIFRKILHLRRIEKIFKSCNS